MTAMDRFDRELAAWLDTEASITAPVGLHAMVIERARVARQRPGWLVAVRGETIGLRRVPGLDRRSLVALAVLALLAASWALVGSGVLHQRRSGPFGGVGTIAFTRGPDDAHSQLFVACADLSNVRPIAAREGRSSGWPSWSPDGRRIAFNANFDDPDTSDNTDVWDIYTIDVDSGAVSKLTRSVGLEGDPAYSDDGRLIAFDSTEPGREGIWVMNADGSGQRRIASTPLPGARSDYGPTFSPDGARIAFTRVVDDRTSRIYVVNVDGTHLTPLTPAYILPSKADWSPDGATILFDAADASHPFQTLYTVRPDGTGLAALTLPGRQGDLSSGYSDPVWSPDGSDILLAHGLIDGTLPPVKLGLAVMRPSDGDVMALSNGDGAEHVPDWSAFGC